MSALAPTLETFFTDRLLRQQHASPHTVAAYRDTFRLLLGFAQRHLKKAPSRLDWADLDAALITAFLDHLESERGNTPRSCNSRLAAIRALFGYAALRHPEHAALIQQVLTIPPKRYTKRPVDFLTTEEVEALLAAPDLIRWEGRRDQALFLLAIQTGLRLSELVGLNRDHVQLASGPHVRCLGKGRKERCVPLTSRTVTVLSQWLRERQAQGVDPVFPTRTGRRLSADAVQRRLTLYAAEAAKNTPSLARKHLTPHVLRHTTAMTLLTAGVDTAVIALWLGHADPRSTQAYLHADLALKEKAVALTTPPNVKPGRYRPTDELLAFLESL